MGQGQGGETARGVPSETPRPRGSAGVFPRNHKSPRLLRSGRGGFSKSRGMTRQAQIGGSRGGGTGSPVAAGGRAGGPRASLAAAPGQASPSPLLAPPNLGSRSRETARAAGPSPPAVGCQAQGLPNTAPARPIRSCAASMPSFGAAGAQFLRFRAPRARFPFRIQRAPGAGVAAFLPGGGFRDRCLPEERELPRAATRSPAGGQDPRTGVPVLPTPSGTRGWAGDPAPRQRRS